MGWHDQANDWEVASMGRFAAGVLYAGGIYFFAFRSAQAKFEEIFMFTGAGFGGGWGGGKGSKGELGKDFGKALTKGLRMGWKIEYTKIQTRDSFSGHDLCYRGGEIMNAGGGALGVRLGGAVISAIGLTETSFYRQRIGPGFSVTNPLNGLDPKLVEFGAQAFYLLGAWSPVYEMS